VLSLVASPGLPGDPIAIVDHPCLSPSLGLGGGFPVIDEDHDLTEPIEIAPPFSCPTSGAHVHDLAERILP
jgi:hypothetical protein